MKRIMLAMMAAFPLLGCGGRDEEKPVFEKVEIERLLPLKAKATTERTDRETAGKLASFFPGMGQGKNSDIAAGWKAAYRLTFVPAKGDPIKITVDSKGELWSEGRGDWRAKPGLKDFLDGLFQEAADKHAGWSEAVNGLRGRLVRYPRPHVNDTEIIGVAVELKSVSATALAVRNDPASVRVRLCRPDGTPIDSTLALPRGGPVAAPQWGVIPPYAYLGFSLYDYGVGVPQGQGALLAILPPVQAWLLKPGKYILRGTFTVQPAAEDNPPKNAWKGQLDLPPLEIEVQ